MDDFLKYGAMGLILALSVLVYRLVRVEQGKVSPSKKNYYGIFVFIGFALVVMFIGIGLELSKDKSHPKKLYAWIHHNRNGFGIDLPDIFEEKVVTLERRFEVYGQFIGLPTAAAEFPVIELGGKPF